MSDSARALDAQIAALMGDRLITRGKWRDYWATGKGSHYSDIDGGSLHYSTDIAAAWRVVERITRIPQSLAESERAANTRFALWFDSAVLWSMSASEAATAICIAALDAVGETQ